MIIENRKMKREREREREIEREKYWSHEFNIVNLSSFLFFSSGYLGPLEMTYP